jgi:hypothetical protein
MHVCRLLISYSLCAFYCESLCNTHAPVQALHAGQQDALRGGPRVFEGLGRNRESQVHRRPQPCRQPSGALMGRQELCSARRNMPLPCPQGVRFCMPPGISMFGGHLALDAYFCSTVSTDRCCLVAVVLLQLHEEWIADITRPLLTLPIATPSRPATMWV